MLISYKSLGNEALLPIKLFYNNGFPFRGSRRNFNGGTKTVARTEKLNEALSIGPTFSDNKNLCFDICDGIERASSRGHRARMQFPQTFCPLCDKQVIVESRSNFGKL